MHLPHQQIKELVKWKMRKLKSIRSSKEILQECGTWELHVQVVPFVGGSLGSVTKNLDKWLGKLDVKISISVLQKTTLLGTARILGKVLEL